MVATSVWTPPLEVIPVFVHAGTILPVEQNGEIVLEVFPGRQTTGILYEDDGASFDYERGAFSLTQFTWKDGKLRVDSSSRREAEGSGQQ